jgi:hypothetical protein
LPRPASVFDGFGSDNVIIPQADASFPVPSTAATPIPAPVRFARPKSTYGGFNDDDNIVADDLVTARPVLQFDDPDVGEPGSRGSWAF